MADSPLSNLDKETQQKIRELQVLEQNFQQLLMQKNAFSMEADEVNYVLAELKKTKGEVSRIVGNMVIIKSTKEEIKKELEKKKGLIEIRMKSIEEQEKVFNDRIENLRKEIMEKIEK